LSGFYLGSGEVDREQGETSVSMLLLRVTPSNGKWRNGSSFLELFFFFQNKKEIKLVPYLIKYSSLL
jgi:hypothetical protein